MKCPFLTIRTEVLDAKGNKIGEELELQECIKDECMIYDVAANQCSLLSSNLKTGVLSDDIKHGFEDMKADLSKNAEAVGDTISNVLQTTQDALLERLEILRKQNEVVVLGFDRVSELFSSKLGEINAIINGFNDKVIANFDALQEAINNQSDTMKSVYIEKGDNIITKLDAVNNALDKLATANKSSMESIGHKIEETIGAIQETFIDKIDVMNELVDGINHVTDLARSEIAGMRLETLNGLHNISIKFEELSKVFSEAILGEFRKEIGGYIDGVKTEIGNLKVDQTTSLSNIHDTAIKYGDIFNKSSEDIVKMRDMMRDLNNNYLESLGKIAGLAEGMRKGVEKVGEGVHDSVKGLVSEMKKEIGSLEKQYEKTFSEVGKLTNMFGELNNRMKDMTIDMQKEFKDTLDRQAKLSDYTKDILKNIKQYFEKEEVRFKEEQEMRREKEGIDHFDRAALYYYRGNYELALNEINKALEIEKRAEYLNLRGLLLGELGRFDESKKTYTEALKLEPHLAEIHNNLGLLYLKMKKLDDAVVSFQEAVKKNVNYALAYVNLGKALIDLERYDDAISAYNRALEIDPSNQEARDAIKLYKEGKIGE